MKKIIKQESRNLTVYFRPHSNPNLYIFVLEMPYNILRILALPEHETRLKAGFIVIVIKS